MLSGFFDVKYFERRGRNIKHIAHVFSELG